MKRRRIAAAVAASALLVSVMTGCSANAGTAAADKLRQHLATVDGIESVVLNEMNALPFMGTTGGTIVVEDVASEERVGEILDILGEYIVANASSVDALDLQWNTMRIEVATTRESNSATLTTASELAADQGIDAVFIGAGDNRIFKPLAPDDSVGVNAKSDIALLAHDQRSLTSAFDAALKLASERGSEKQYPGPTVATADGLFLISAEAGFDKSTLPTDALAVYEAISGEIPLLGAILKPDSAEIHVPSLEERDRAEHLASLVTTSPGFTLTVNGGNLSAFGDPSPDGEALHAATSGLASVISVSVVDDSVTVELDSIDAVDEFRAAMGDPLQYGGLAFIRITVPSIPGDFTTPGYSLTAPPAQLDEFLALGDALQSSGQIDAMGLALAQSSIALKNADQDAMRQVFAASKGLWPEGLKVGIRTFDGENGFFTISNGELAQAQDANSAGDQSFIDAVLAAWAAA